MGSEIWRAVVGLAGFYEVSSYGRVRSLDRVLVQRHPRRADITVSRHLKGRLMPSHSDGRYLYVVMGQRRKARVHVLVAEAFIGPRPAGQYVLHRDDDRSNNSLENLRYGTCRENHDDRRRNGHSFRGSGNGASLIDEATAAIIITAKTLLPNRVIGPLAGVTGPNVSCVGRRTWLHVEPATLDETLAWLIERGIDPIALCQALSAAYDAPEPHAAAVRIIQSSRPIPNGASNDRK